MCMWCKYLHNASYLWNRHVKMWPFGQLKLRPPAYRVDALTNWASLADTQARHTPPMPEHGEEHVKKLFSTAVIVNEDTHSNLVRGHWFTGEDTNIFHPWSLKLEGFFRKSTNISFYMVTNIFIYTTGSSHIIDDCSRAVWFCQSLIGK